MSYPAKTIQVDSWLLPVIRCLLPYPVFEDSEVVKHVKYDHLSVNSFMKYLGRLTHQAESKSSQGLPDKCFMFFDAWYAKESHYVTIFTSFPNDSELDYRTVILGISPM